MDEELLDAMITISEHCTIHKTCDECVFKVFTNGGDTVCGLNNSKPSFWPEIEWGEVGNP